MKKSAWILTGIFVFFLIVGIYVNRQQGLRLSGDFWHLKNEGVYISPSGCRLRCNAEDGLFTLEAGDWSAEIRAEQKEDGVQRFDFPDGTATICREDSFPLVSIEVGGVVMAFDDEIILTDIEADGYRYAQEVQEEVQYFYQNGEKTPVGEMRMLVSADGMLIDSTEYFYDSGAEPPVKERVVLENGMTISSEDTENVLYLNPEGEYLVNAKDLFGFLLPSEGMLISKRILANFLMDAADGKSVRRGEPTAIILYVLCYLMGAVSWLWPDKMAFLGSRWQYREEPELSDAGLLAMKAGAVIAMGMGIFMLLIPLGGA